jgi:hypothetical protein
LRIVRGLLRICNARSVGGGKGRGVIADILDTFGHWWSRIANPYYEIENLILLCAAVVVVIDDLLRRGHLVVGYCILAVTIISQVWTLFTGTYGPLLLDDLHKHPYYEAGLAVKKSTSADSGLLDRPFICNQAVQTLLTSDGSNLGSRRLANWNSLIRSVNWLNQRCVQSAARGEHDQ